METQERALQAQENRAEALEDLARGERRLNELNEFDHRIKDFNYKLGFQFYKLLRYRNLE